MGESEDEISKVNMVGALLAGGQDGLAKKVQVAGKGGGVLFRGSGSRMFCQVEDEELQWEEVNAKTKSTITGVKYKMRQVRGI